MDSRVARGALRLSHISLIMPTRNARRELFADARMAFKAELSDLWTFQHFGVGRSVRRMARGTPFQFDRTVFEHERALFVGVAFNTGGVGTDGELGLFLLEPAVRVVTVAARHGSLENLVVKRLAELCFDLRVAADTELRLARFEHRGFGNAGFLDRCVADLRYRSGFEVLEFGAVSGMTVSTADIVAPVLAASKIVVALLSGMARKASFRYCFRILSLEGNDLADIAAFCVLLARAVARFAADDLSLPGIERVQLSVLRVADAFELRFVTGGACFAADVTVVLLAARVCRDDVGHLCTV